MPCNATRQNDSDTKHLASSTDDPRWPPPRGCSCAVFQSRVRRCRWPGTKSSPPSPAGAAGRSAIPPTGGFAMRCCWCPSPSICRSPARAWARQGGWMPRIETTQTLAASLGPPAGAAAGQVSFDTANDRLSARRLLASQRWAADWSRRDPRGYAHALALLVDAAQALARAAAAVPPERREAHWDEARALLGPVAGPGRSRAAAGPRRARMGRRRRRRLAHRPPATRCDRRPGWRCRPAAPTRSSSGCSPRPTRRCRARCSTPTPTWPSRSPPSPRVRRRRRAAHRHRRLRRLRGRGAGRRRAAARPPGARRAAGGAGGAGPQPDPARARAARAPARAARRRDRLAAVDHARRRAGHEPAARRRAERRHRRLDRLAEELRRAAAGPGWRRSKRGCAANAGRGRRRSMPRGSIRRPPPLWQQRRRGHRRLPRAAAQDLRRLAARARRGAAARAARGRRSTPTTPARRCWPRSASTPAGRRRRPGAPTGDEPDDVGRRFPRLGRHGARVGDLPAARAGGPAEQGAAVVVTPLARAMLRPFAAAVLPGCDEKRLGRGGEAPALLGEALADALGVPGRGGAARRARRSPSRSCCGCRASRCCAAAPTAPSRWRRARCSSGCCWRRPATARVDAWSDPRIEPAGRAAAGAAAAAGRRRRCCRSGCRASACEALRACPYRFFALHMLGLRDADEFDDEVEKRDYGTLAARRAACLPSRPRPPAAAGLRDRDG